MSEPILTETVLLGSVPGRILNHLKQEGADIRKIANAAIMTHLLKHYPDIVIKYVVETEEELKNAIPREYQRKHGKRL